MTFMQLDVPFVATSLTKVTVGAPPQLSVAVTRRDVRSRHESRSTARSQDRGR